MPRGSKLASLTLTDEQQNQLQGIAQSATLPYALVVRARIILASAEGLTNAAVAKRVGVTPHTVGKWRRRFPSPCPCGPRGAIGPRQGARELRRIFPGWDTRGRGATGPAECARAGR